MTVLDTLTGLALSVSPRLAPIRVFTSHASSLVVVSHGGKCLILPKNVKSTTHRIATTHHDRQHRVLLCHSEVGNSRRVQVMSLLVLFAMS